ncbi:MAG: thioredoxin domain-containing protein [Deltaproteobacteria bacterium]|nr:thioredoxin domain-containing protein [Deltaproteobacteria bacterium]
MSESDVRSENRLKSEKSPYLKQHSHNPVDWYPWSQEALQKAKNEDRPIMLSIGYSTCHWCHVMERESFEDPEVARIMNDNFVSIKVDREERPDLDSLYMKAVQAMAGHAGWPLTVFATPEGVPFYGGSYFPPDDGYGLPSFKKVLLAASLAYRKNRERISVVTKDIGDLLARKSPALRIKLEAGLCDNAFEAARVFFDPVDGGFGRATKFPHSMFLKFLLKYSLRTGNNNALAVVKKSLTAMASGGIYDHLGGGFHRYSVDERWDVPHFEKMLYDNALLTGLYSAAHEATGVTLYKEVALETIAYLLREMRDEGGGFYSAQDADVDGKEGEYYLWGLDEVESILGAKRAESFRESFPMTEEGNCEGKNVLRINSAVKGLEAFPDDGIREMKAVLFKARMERKPPQTDKKIITAWNGLVITALSRAAAVFKDAVLLDHAKKCAEFILVSVVDGEGRLLRYHLNGSAAVKANLEDYALFGGGLASIYEASGEYRWLSEAKRIAERMTELFYDGTDGLFFDTGSDQEKLFVRELDLYDNDVPSGNSAAADLLLKVYCHGRSKRYRDMAEGILSSVEGIRDEPLSYGNFLFVLECFIEGKEDWGKHLRQAQDSIPQREAR